MQQNYVINYILFRKENKHCHISRHFLINAQQFKLQWSILWKLVLLLIHFRSNRIKKALFQTPVWLLFIGACFYFPCFFLSFVHNVFSRKITSKTYHQHSFIRLEISFNFGLSFRHFSVGILLKHPIIYIYVQYRICIMRIYYIVVVARWKSEN